MKRSIVHLRNVAGTEAAMGWAGAHTLVVDRPDGVAGGAGLGFNGGQLLGLSLGGCFCNDLRFVAHEMGVALETVEVDVTITLDGAPLVATHAALSVRCIARDGTDVSAIVDAAAARCTIANTLRRGLDVQILQA